MIPGAGGTLLHKMLRNIEFLQDILPGRDNFYDLLRENGLLIRKRRKWYVATTNSDHPYHKWSDLTKGRELTGKDSLWVSDITYLRVNSGFCYLSLVTDAYSRKIVGYHLSQTLKATGCIIALEKAIKQLSDAKNKRKLVHHSDRGIQYCCDAYVGILQNHSIKISMTQDGNPYDNALAERTNGLLKHHFGLEKTFANYSSAVAAVAVAVDAYNTIRPHSSVSDLTPSEAHITDQPLKLMWKQKPSRKRAEKINSETQTSTGLQLYPQMANGNTLKIEESHLVDKIVKAKTLVKHRTSSRQNRNKTATVKLKQ